MVFRIAVICAVIAMSAAQWFVFCYAPLEAQMKLAQKIFYYHLPLAWWGLISFFAVFAASLAYIKTRNPRWERLADSAAEIGVVLIGLALVTGSIWAKAAWWTWWVWDHRLTTTLVMWFIFAGYLVLRGLDMPRERRALIKAVLGVVAFLDVPLVFFATRLWQSRHPVGIVASRDGMEPEMRLTLFVCLAAFGIVWAALLYIRCRIAALEDRTNGLTNSPGNLPGNLLGNSSGNSLGNLSGRKPI
ncbi:MAG: Heme exporter protein C [Desulfovibrio sp.]